MIFTTLLERLGTKAKVAGIRLSAVGEIVFFFIVTLLIALFFNIPFNYFVITPHPFWIIVVFIAAQYGTNEALLAATVSTLVLLAGPLPNQTIFQDKFDYFFLIIKTPLLWYVMAVFLGELRLRQIKERDGLKEIAAKSKEQVKEIADSYHSLKKVKEELEVRVVSEMQTALMAYSFFKRLEELGSKEEIIKGALDLTRTLIAPQKFSIFLLEEGVFSCFAKEGWEEKDQFATTFAPDTDLFEEIVAKRRTLSILNPGDVPILGPEGVLATPIFAALSQSVLGMIKIEFMHFAHVRMTTIETLRGIGEWVGTAYESLQNKEGRAFEAPAKKPTLATEKSLWENVGKRLKIDILLLHLSVLEPQTFSVERRQEIAKTFQNVVTEHLRAFDQIIETDESGTSLSILLLATSPKNGEMLQKEMSGALDDAFRHKVRLFHSLSILHEERR